MPTAMNHKLVTFCPLFSRRHLSTLLEGRLNIGEFGSCFAQVRIHNVKRYKQNQPLQGPITTRASTLSAGPAQGFHSSSALSDGSKE